MTKYIQLTPSGEFLKELPNVNTLWDANNYCTPEKLIFDNRHEQFNVVELLETPKPEGDVVEPADPALVGGAWRQQWTVRAYTAEEIAERNVTIQQAAEAESAAQAEAAAQAAKALGFTYNGVQVPVLNEDAVGAMQLDLAFTRFSVPSGVFHLSNGIKLPLTIEEWPAFSAQFFATRASFFQE